LAPDGKRRHDALRAVLAATRAVNLRIAAEGAHQFLEAVAAVRANVLINRHQL
jgi:hypothetical protein